MVLLACIPYADTIFDTWGEIGESRVSDSCSLRVRAEKRQGRGCGEAVRHSLETLIDSIARLTRGDAIRGIGTCGYDEN